MSPTPTGWLSIAEAARYFGIGRSTIDRLIDSGVWPTPVVLPGMRTRRFSPEQIEWVKANAVPAAA